MYCIVGKLGACQELWGALELKLLLGVPILRWAGPPAFFVSCFGAECNFRAWEPSSAAASLLRTTCTWLTLAIAVLQRAQRSCAPQRVLVGDLRTVTNTRFSLSAGAPACRERCSTRVATGSAGTPQARRQRARAPVQALPDVLASQDLAGQLEVFFDGASDPDSTVITVSGPAHDNLLLQLTGAFNVLELTVASASIRADDEGGVLDVFRVTNRAGDKARMRLVAPEDARAWE